MIYGVAVLNLRPALVALRPSRHPRMPWNRINSLIDGIFGFSATVLMLRLAAPVYERGELGAELLQQVPSYLLYLGGFFQLLSAWTLVRRMSSWTTGIDFIGMLLVFASLTMWATSPFTVEVIADAVGHDADFGAAVRLQMVTLAVANAGFACSVWWLHRRGYYRDGLDPAVLALALLGSFTAPVWPVLGFLLTYIDPWAGLAALVVAVLLALAPLDAMSTEMYDAADA